MASELSGNTSQYIRSDKGNQYLTTATTYTEWFGRFMTGLQESVGDRRRQNAAILIALMMDLQFRLEVRWLEVNKENDWKEKRKSAEKDYFLYGIIALACVDLKHLIYCYTIYNNI